MCGCVFLCTRRMLTVIAARPCVCVSLVVHTNKAYARGDCCEAMYACASCCIHDQGVCSW